MERSGVSCELLTAASTHAADAAERIRAVTYAHELDELGPRGLLDPVTVPLVSLVARGVVLLLHHREGGEGSC